MPYALCPMPYALCPWVPHLYEKGYISRLKLADRPGSVGYLESGQSAASKCLLPSKNRNLAELQEYIFENYDVVFDSKQSYYTLFNQARTRWKKNQKRNPK